MRGKRVGRSYLHILDQRDPKNVIGLCGIWINPENWAIEECADDCQDPDFICSRCLAKQEKIRNPPPPPPPKKLKITKEQAIKNDWDRKLKEWEELIEKPK